MASQNARSSFCFFIYPQAKDYWAEINFSYFSYFSFQGAITDTFFPSRVYPSTLFDEASLGLDMIITPQTGE